MRARLAGETLETVKDGFLQLPQGPGLGITVNEAALNEYQEREAVNRRHFLTGSRRNLAAGQLVGAPARRTALSFCDCALQPQAAAPAGAARSRHFGSKVRITNVKTFGVTIPGRRPDRPYVFVKLETDAGPGGLGRRHARRQGRRGDGLHQRFPRVPHRRRPDAGGASLAVDVRPQLLPRRTGDGLRDLRASIRRCGTCAARSWACRSTSCWAAPTIRDGVRGYYIANARTLDDLQQAARDRRAAGHHRASKAACRATTSGSRPTQKISAAIKHVRCCAKGSARISISPSISTPRPVPAWRRLS